MPFANNDGVRLYWRFDGEEERPVLVLLNSIGTDMSLWDRAAPFLLQKFRLLRMDWRGHGGSDAVPGDYSLDTLTSDVVAVMDAAGVDSAALCGVSLGGMVAMNTALMARSRVRTLILACTSAHMDRATWQTRIDTVRARGIAKIAEAVIERFFTEEFRRTHPEAVGTVRAGLLATQVDGYAGCGAAIRDMVLRDRLSAIDVPALIVAGSKDVSTPFEGHGDAIVRAIPDAIVEHLPTAHLACLEAPAAFAGAVFAFLLNDMQVCDAAQTMFEAGLKVRREVLGDAWVDRTLANRTPFNADFQAMITRYAWNEIWDRPGLDRRTRRLLVVAITAALGCWEEFRLHVRAGIEQGGFGEGELKETLMQTAIYAGVPAANTAFREAEEVLSRLKNVR